MNISKKDNKGGNENEDEVKIRIPGEGDVISGSGLPSGKFVIDKVEDGVHGVKHVSTRELAKDGSFDPSKKEEEYLIIIDGCKVLDLGGVKFHNKMKKKFVRKGE